MESSIKGRRVNRNTPFLKEIFQKGTKGMGTKPSIPPAVTGQDYDKPFIVKLYCQSLKFNNDFIIS